LIFSSPSGQSAKLSRISDPQHRAHRITNVQQLDDTGVGELFLHVVVVDEREVPVGGSAPGQSLHALIGETRSRPPVR